MPGTLIALAAIPVSAIVWGLSTGRWPAIVLALLLAYINFLVIPVEEKNLRGVFGVEYQKYSERVGRWL